MNETQITRMKVNEAMKELKKGKATDMDGCVLE